MLNKRFKSQSLRQDLKVKTSFQPWKLTIVHSLLAWSCGHLWSARPGRYHVGLLFGLWDVLRLQSLPHEVSPRVEGDGVLDIKQKGSATWHRTRGFLSAVHRCGIICALEDMSSYETSFQVSTVVEHLWIHSKKKTTTTLATTMVAICTKSLTENCCKTMRWPRNS